MSEGMKRGTPSDRIVDHEVEVVLLVQTTMADVKDALTRSGLTVGSRIGETMIEGIRIYSPDEDEDDAS